MTTFAKAIAIGMTNDILESISQGSDGTYNEKNLRIEEVADEIKRRSRIYASQPCDGKEHVSSLELEMRAAEDLAKEHVFSDSLVNIE